MSANVTFSLLHFDQLSTRQLYEMLQLRSRVFVIEQQCLYNDLDGIDISCHHLLAYTNDGYLVGTLRLIAPGDKEVAKIGRVVTASSHRKRGIGRELMQRAIDAIMLLYGTKKIQIAAQFYLKSFYESMGFVQCSNVYLDDGIEHIDMLHNGAVSS